MCWAWEDVSREYPVDWKPGGEPYYPLGNEENVELYQRYVELAKKHGNVIFGGRLGRYKYYDMDKCIAATFELAREVTGINLAQQVIEGTSIS